MNSLLCPFPPCREEIDLVHHRAANLGTPAIDLIREHRVNPDSWFGICPASHMVYPLMDHERTMLAEQASTLATMSDARQPGLLNGPLPQRAPGKAWKPAGKLFRDSPAGDPDKVGPVAYPKLELVRDPAPTGGSMASVEETRAAIVEANILIAEAQQAAAEAVRRFNDALVRVKWLLQGSADPLSLPQLGRAVESCEVATVLASVAIETNANYGAQL